MNLSTEYRAFSGLELRDGEAGFIATLAGLAAPFGRASKLLTGGGRPRAFIETIAKGAFSETLKRNRDVLFLYSHDSDKPLARTPRTLSLNENADGLRFEAKLSDTSVARDLVANVRSGVVSGMSFAFRVVRETWSAGDGVDRRTLLQVDLDEISATAMPAYPDTQVAARALETFHEIREACPDLLEVMQANGRFEYGDGRTPLRDYWAAKLAALEQ